MQGLPAYGASSNQGQQFPQNQFNQQQYPPQNQPFQQPMSDAQQQQQFYQQQQQQPQFINQQNPYQQQQPFFQQPQGMPYQQPQGMPYQQPYGMPYQQPQGMPYQQPQQNMPYQQPQQNMPYQQPYQQPQNYQQQPQQVVITTSPIFASPYSQIDPYANQVGQFGLFQENIYIQEQYGGKHVQLYITETKSNQDHNPFFHTNLKHMHKRSKQVGKVHHNTYVFDDYFGTNLNKEFHDPQVEEITVYHTQHFIVGFQFTFKNLTSQFIGPLHKGWHNKHQVHKKKLQLSFGEHITEISGRCGEWIDKIKIVTSKNQVLEVGGNGGGEFQNLLPYGFHTVICFGGSCSEYLDSFYVVYK